MGDLGSKLPLSMVVRNHGDATNVKAPDERRYGKLKLSGDKRLYHNHIHQHSNC